MKFSATMIQGGDGRWIARHQSKEWGRVESTANSPQEATEQLRREIRYRLELCPCSGEMYRDVEVDIVDTSQTDAQ